MEVMMRTIETIRRAVTGVVVLSLCLLVAPAGRVEATPLLPPSISEAFNPDIVTFFPPDVVTTLTFTIANPNASDSLFGLFFFDVLPSGLFVNTPPNLTDTCGGTASTIFSDQISLSGGILAGGASCTVGLVIQATAPGTYVNVTGDVSSTTSGTGNSASATLEVSPSTTSTVPEPGTIFLFASGLGGLGLLRKRSV